MTIGRLLLAVPLAATLALVITTPRSALADNVVADDQIVQGNLCVGTTCANGEVFDTGGEIKLKGTDPSIRFIDTNVVQIWDIFATNSGFGIRDLTTVRTPFAIFP